MSEAPQPNPYESPHSAPAVQLPPHVPGAEFFDRYTECAKRKAKIQALGCLTLPLAFVVATACCYTSLGYLATSLFPQYGLDSMWIASMISLIVGVGAGVGILLLLSRTLREIDAQYEGPPRGRGEAQKPRDDP